MPVGDPFDFSNADPNAAGFLGQSPQWWQHLAMFGANLAADASQRNAMGFPTYGSGIAGPLGAATAQTMAEAQQQQAGRASLTAQNIANETNALGLPVARRRAQIQLQALNNPQMFGGGGASQDSGTAATAPDQAPTPGVVPPEQRLPMLQAAVAGTPISPRVMDAVVQQESGWMPTAKNGPNGEGGNGLAQVLQSTAANPGFGMQPHPDALTDPVANLKFGAQYLYARGKAAGMSDGDFSDPAKLPVALAAYHANVDNPRYVAQVMARMQQPPSWAAAQQGQQGGGVQPGLTSTGALAGQFNAQADQLEQRAQRAIYNQWLGLPTPDDPAMLRQQALAFRQKALDLQAAGPEQAAKTQAESQNKPLTDRYGNLYLMGPDGQFKYLGRGSEVREGFDPTTGNYTFQDVGGVGIGAQQPGGGGTGAPGASGGSITAKPGPGTEGFLKGASDVQKDAIENERKMVNDDMADYLENTLPGKNAMYQLRDQIDGSDTGALGTFRANVRNYFQTAFPSLAGDLGVDATPAQVFQKLALVGAGKQERGDLGSRGGFRAMEMYANANPNLEMQPTANHDMANAWLINFQAHEDYVNGVTDYFNKQLNNTQASGSTKGYKSVLNYDQQFAQKMQPQLYAAAIAAINGQPSAVWTKGLTGAQQQIVGGIVKRADPNASIHLLHPKTGQDVLVPVSAFTKTIGPTDIAGTDAGR